MPVLFNTIPESNNEILESIERTYKTLTKLGFHTIYEKSKVTDSNIIYFDNILYNI